MDHIFDTEHLYKSYFKMALPVVFGLVVTLVYNLADTFFIGQTHNDLQVAAVLLYDLIVPSPSLTWKNRCGNIA